MKMYLPRTFILDRPKMIVHSLLLNLIKRTIEIKENVRIVIKKKKKKKKSM